MSTIFFYCITIMLFMSKVIMDQKQQHALNINFFQRDYNLTPERVEIVSYNKHYFNRLEMATFKYNRSTTAFNLTANVRFDISEMEVVLQAYKFLSNEYRLFPLRFQVNACSALKSNVGGLGMYPCGNFTGCRVLKERTYFICNWTTDPSKFPPMIPSGRYMVEFQGFHFSTQILVGRAYAAVTRPEV